MVVLEASRDIPNSKLQYSSWHFKKKLYFCRLNKTILGKTLLQYKRQLAFGMLNHLPLGRVVLTIPILG